MGSSKSSRRIAVLAAIGAALVSKAIFAAPADDVQRLLQQGKASEAYALGSEHPEEFGNPGFDFYFGVAAVDAGHAGEGVLALERYIANFPENQTARLELARAYFVLGDNARAREEFDKVLKTNPPGDVKANVQRFMDAIRAREAAYQTTGGFYAEMGVGHDTNVNAGVSNANINLPVFGPVTLVSGLKTKDDFATLGVGGNVSYPIQPGISLYGAGSVDTKLDRHQTSFDQDNINAAGGLSIVRDKNLYRISGVYNELAVGHDWYRQFIGASGELIHQVDEFQSIGGALQLGNLYYAGANEPRNADLWAASLTYRRAFIGSFQPLITLSPSIGAEHNTHSRPDLGRSFYGGRAAVAVTPAPNWSFAAGVTYQKSKYDDADPTLRVARNDKFLAVDATLSYALTRNWSVRGEYQYYKNNSGIPIFTFDRALYMLKLRYEFK